MAIGKELVSAYAGAADVSSFENVGKVSETKTHKISYSEKERELYSLYDEVRTIRESNSVSEERLVTIFSILKNEFFNDWLLPLEIYELAT